MSDFSTGSATSVVGRESVSHQFRVEQVVLEKKKCRYNLNSMVPAILAIIWKCTSADQLRVFNFICVIMTCCKLGRKSAYHRSMKNISKVINILWFDYLNCHLMISLAQAIKVIQKFDQWKNVWLTLRPLFVQHSTSHTFDSFTHSLSSSLPLMPCIDFNCFHLWLCI